MPVLTGRTRIPNDVHVDVSFPIDTPRGRLGYYRCRLGATSVSSIAAAIASAEGFGQPGAIPTKANNPGDLELGDIGYGTLKAAGGNQITIFPTLEAGQAALENQVNKIVSGGSSVYDPSMSLTQVGQIYSGGSSSWAQNVASFLGVDPSTPIGELVGGGGIELTDSSDAGTTASTGDWVVIALFGVAVIIAARALL